MKSSLYTGLKKIKCLVREIDGVAPMVADPRCGNSTTLQISPRSQTPQYIHITFESIMQFGNCFGVYILSKFQLPSSNDVGRVGGVGKSLA